VIASLYLGYKTYSSLPTFDALGFVAVAMLLYSVPALFTFMYLYYSLRETVQTDGMVEDDSSVIVNTQKTIIYFVLIALVFIAAGAAAFWVSTLDEPSKQAAEERDNSELNREELDRLINELKETIRKETGVTEIETERSVFGPFPISTTTEYELTKENILAGKIAIALQPGYGEFYFFNEAGEAVECYSNPTSDRPCNYSSIEFIPGSIKIRGFTTSVASDPAGNEYKSAVLLIERDSYTDSNKHLYVQKLVNYSDYYAFVPNVYYGLLRPADLLDFSVTDQITIQQTRPPQRFNGGWYDYLRFVSDTKSIERALQTQPAKYGSIGTLLKVDNENGQLIFESPLYGYIPHGVNEAVKQGPSIGKLQYRFQPGKFDINEYRFISNRQLTSAIPDSEQPVYFKEPCGLPYTFSDTGISVLGVDSNIWVDINASVYDQDEFKLTTATYGYDPAKWGMVVDTVDAASYIDAINRGLSFSDLAVERLLINGVAVRHTLPYEPPRPCDGKLYEQYQWAIDGDIYSVNVNYDPKNIATEDVDRQLFELVTALVKGLSFVPANESL